MNDIEKMKQQSAVVAEFLKTVAHPDRLMVLCLLTQGEMNVSELSQHTQLSQSAFSQHLSVLRKQNIVKVRKESQQVFYSLADERIEALLAVLKTSFCE
ncbi:ArsR/SmtB family transcription factor [Motilimonas eburnea]|uniref:ArsR/SmtB family transcription factor n=1 Tax=Motilimonas eburnea TaxID=1737488 RepID=UPI001E4FC2B0|nr:metalloregulator ArsR/SmtB family transcription factor [Motilimonas eburnea]MCE2573429.1 metalloregulator ArsR/SmtB family transcription factor [Motilimonas eburnea]